jgi:hypothetical protein
MNMDFSAISTLATIAHSFGVRVVTAIPAKNGDCWVVFGSRNHEKMRCWLAL